MAQYHVNRKGEAGRCRALLGHCPYGNSEEHFSSPEEARRYYEATHAPLSEGLKRPKVKAHASADDLANELKDEAQALETLEAHHESEEKLLEELQNTWSKPEFHEQASRREIKELSQRIMAMQEAALTRSSLILKSKRELATKRDMQSMQAQGEINKEAKDLLSKDFNAKRVANMARFATAHNSGSTVVSAQEEDGTVLLRMSSWPRAQEAAQHFKKKGWLTEFTGDNNGGELLRVVNPDAPSTVIKKSEDLQWAASENSFTVEASEFGEFPSRGFTFISQKDGSAVRMLPHEEKRDAENDVLYWTFTPENKAHNWKVIVYND